MTPAELRALREAATRDVAAMVPVSPEDLGYVQRSDALDRLEELAPTLADLVVDFERVLREAKSAFGYIAQTQEFHPEQSVKQYAKVNADLIHAALASLAEVEG